MLRRFAVILSLVIAFTTLFSGVAFADSDLDSNGSWDQVPSLFVGDEDLGQQVEELEAREEFATLRGSEVEILGSTPGTTEKRNYNQPEFYVKDGYDVVSVFITPDSSNEIYEGKVYFVVSGNGQWLLYNYKQETADKYLERTEDFKGMLIPAKKSDARADDPATSIDEGKIPLLKRSVFNGMYANWRNFSDISFTTVDGKLVYATYDVTVDGSTNPDEKSSGEGEEKRPEELPTTTPSQPENGTVSQNLDENLPSPSWNSSTNFKWLRYTVSLNSGNTYRVFVTRSVSFNGKKHVGINQKAGKKKSNDVNVWLFLNGEVVDANLYKLTFKNNVNCNGYAGNSKSAPYVKIKLKFKNKALKLDKKQMGRKGFSFYITPIDLTKGSVSLTGKKATYTGPDGIVLKMKPLKANGKGDYTITNQDGKQAMLGANNYTGAIIIGTATPVNNTTTNPGTGNGGIY